MFTEGGEVRPFNGSNFNPQTEGIIVQETPQERNQKLQWVIDQQKARDEFYKKWGYYPDAIFNIDGKQITGLQMSQMSEKSDSEQAEKDRLALLKQWADKDKADELYKQMQEQSTGTAPQGKTAEEVASKANKTWIVAGWVISGVIIIWLAIKLFFKRKRKKKKSYG